MRAGRKLDALVAEKVMGWDKCPEGVGCEGCDHAILATANGFYVGHPDEQWKPFAPSTDIAAAWKVVEKMQADHLHVEVTGWGEPDAEDNWMVDVAVATGGFWESLATEEADTAPHAICLAALKATGVEVPT